jgi:acetylornithine/succinyldiaminopimelate/putrescine aminotransferase
MHSFLCKPLRRFIHQAPLYNAFPLIASRGQGAYLYAIPTDDSGSAEAKDMIHSKLDSTKAKQAERRYLDFTAGIAVLALGHADPKCAEIMQQQALRLGKNILPRCNAHQVD